MRDGSRASGAAHPWDGGAAAKDSRLRLLQADVLVGPREVEKGIQPDRRLLDARADAVQARRLEDRRVHHALVHQALDLMQQRLALLAVALLRLLDEEVVEVRMAAIGVRGA